MPRTAPTPRALTSAQAKKMNRKELLAYATRHCLPLAECMDDDELAAMSNDDIRFELTTMQDIHDDRMADAYNSAF